VFAEAISHHLDKRWAFSTARAVGGFANRVIDGDHVLAVLDPDARHSEARRAVNDPSAGHRVGRRRERVEVVLAKEDDRQLVGRSQVHGFIENPLVRGAVTEECYRDAVLAKHLRRKASADRNRNGRAGDTGFAEAADFVIGQVQRSALALADARRLADEFGHQGTKRRAHANRVTVAAVVACHVVALGERHAGTHHLSFLTDAGVNCSGNIAALDHLRGALVEQPDAQHSALHFQKLFFGEAQAIYHCFGTIWIICSTNDHLYLSAFCNASAIYSASQNHEFS
jgi:hypothetical protein